MFVSGLWVLELGVVFYLVTCTAEASTNRACLHCLVSVHHYSIGPVMIGTPQYFLKFIEQECQIFSQYTDKISVIL